MAESELEESVPWLVEQQQQSSKTSSPFPRMEGWLTWPPFFYSVCPPCHHYATTIDDGRDLVFPSLSHFCR